jgi:hypothetical protein
MVGNLEHSTAELREELEHVCAEVLSFVMVYHLEYADVLDQQPRRMHPVE